jgi:hypothetical protein
MKSPRILQALRHIEADVAGALTPAVIIRLCDELGHVWRERQLNPVTTVHAFLQQVLHGNTACNHVPHLVGGAFSGDAYIQARLRLPLELLQRLLNETRRRLQDSMEQAERWLGHRVWTLDGSTCSMPDTPQLQQAFGQPGQQTPGCGFPVAHLLVLFHAQTGLLLQLLAAPLRTHDLSQAVDVHSRLQAGDVLLADRAFTSFAHLALLLQSGIQAVFRAHQKQIINFRKGRIHVPPSPPYPRWKGVQGLPRSRWIKWLGTSDQLVEYFKPKECPSWLSIEQYQALPPSLVVREMRYRIQAPGYRTREVTLVTTLLDAQVYTAAEVAKLYGQRWQIETNLAHLKTTMGMDVLRSKSLAGVLKELTMFAIVYNLVRLVMGEAASQLRVPAWRISFIDALRWLSHSELGRALCELVVLPLRPGRHEPRVKKRRPKEFPRMTQPRSVLQQRLMQQGLAA